MNDIGWMLVALVVAAMAWHRVGQLGGGSSSIRKMQAQLAQWPELEEFLRERDEILGRIAALEAGGNTIGAVVSRANDITKDMVALKTVLSEVRADVAKMHTKASIRQAVNG